MKLDTVLDAKGPLPQEAEVLLALQHIAAAPRQDIAMLRTSLKDRALCYVIYVAWRAATMQSLEAYNLRPGAAALVGATNVETVPEQLPELLGGVPWVLTLKEWTTIHPTTEMKSVAFTGFDGVGSAILCAHVRPSAAHLTSTLGRAKERLAAEGLSAAEVEKRLDETRVDARNGRQLVTELSSKELLGVKLNTLQAAEGMAGDVAPLLTELLPAVIGWVLRFGILLEAEHTPLGQGPTPQRTNPKAKPVKPRAPKGAPKFWRERHVWLDPTRVAARAPGRGTGAAVDLSGRVLETRDLQGTLCRFPRREDGSRSAGYYWRSAHSHSYWVGRYATPFVKTHVHR